PAVDDNGQDCDLKVNVTAPTGDFTGPFSAGGFTASTGSAVIAQVTFYPAVPPSKQQLIRISVGPTGWPDAGVPLAPHGLWRVSITKAGASAEIEDIHAWIQRDDTRSSFGVQPRQSYFDDPE